ncbi:F-box protein SKIP19-like [Panicum miliaceum]|uniref:F-box protein SKIP19-like n=1 Tax=Panicum miliaceum TaxID=4540 RepID=A0A3L6QUM1_PANMI|nr:F-box protein SKIP19-like [Panicum miliaceum]
MLAADKVCRSWRRAACDEPVLWRRIDMRGHAALSRRSVAEFIFGECAWARNLADLNQMAVDAVVRSKGKCEAFWGERAGGTGDFLSFLADQCAILLRVREKTPISRCMIECLAKGCADDHSNILLSRAS